MANTASAPPTEPPTMAATGVVSLLLDASVAVVLLVPVEAGVEVMVAAVNVVEPPVAWYAISWSSRFIIAGSRSPSGQPFWLHAFVLQQPVEARQRSPGCGFDS